MNKKASRKVLGILIVAIVVVLVILVLTTWVPKTTGRTIRENFPSIQVNDFKCIRNIEQDYSKSIYREKYCITFNAKNVGQIPTTLNSWIQLGLHRYEGENKDISFDLNKIFGFGDKITYNQYGKQLEIFSACTDYYYERTYISSIFINYHESGEKITIYGNEGGNVIDSGSCKEVYEDL